MGACDTMLLTFAGQNPLDLGASVGGAEITYTPTVFAVEIDQALAPVTFFKTKEELGFAVALAQTSMDKVTAAFNYASSNIVTVASGTLASATAPTVVFTGTPATTTYTYELVAYNYNGDAIPSTTTSVSTGAAALNGTNYNTITWTQVTGAVGYKVIRTVGGATQGQIGGNIGAGLPLSLQDTGLAATTYTAAVSQPAMPNQDTLTWGNQAYMPLAQFDFTVPKNDGTTNHLIGHLNKVVSAKAVKLNFNREKHTEISKLELECAVDLTQPAGQQLGWLREQY